MAENELIDQVDEDNNIIGPVMRSEAHEKGLWHRSVHIWVYSKQGNVLVQRRSLEKADSPGKLDMAIAGHVKSGESISEAIISESKEELGIDIDPNQLGEPVMFKIARESEQMPALHSQFIYTYFLEIDEATDLKFNDGEVIEVLWITFDSFSKILEHGDLYTKFAYHTDDYLQKVVGRLKGLING
jgi:isopentenyldiphosphate isomerase